MGCLQSKEVPKGEEEGPPEDKPGSVMNAMYKRATTVTGGHFHTSAAAFSSFGKYGKLQTFNKVIVNNDHIFACLVEGYGGVEAASHLQRVAYAAFSTALVRCDGDAPTALQIMLTDMDEALAQTSKTDRAKASSGAGLAVAVINLVSQELHTVALGGCMVMVARASGSFNSTFVAADIIADGRKQRTPMDLLRRSKHADQMVLHHNRKHVLGYSLYKSKMVADTLARMNKTHAVEHMEPCPPLDPETGSVSLMAGDEHVFLLSAGFLDLVPCFDAAALAHEYRTSMMNQYLRALQLSDGGSSLSRPGEERERLSTQHSDPNEVAAVAEPSRNPSFQGFQGFHTAAANGGGPARAQSGEVSAPAPAAASRPTAEPPHREDRTSGHSGVMRSSKRESFTTGQMNGTDRNSPGGGGGSRGKLPQFNISDMLVRHAAARLGELGAAGPQALLSDVAVVSIAVEFPRSVSSQQAARKKAFDAAKGPNPLVAFRWQLLRSYCKFLMKRRQHVLETWWGAAFELMQLADKQARHAEMLAWKHMNEAVQVSRTGQVMRPAALPHHHAPHHGSTGTASSTPNSRRSNGSSNQTASGKPRRKKGSHPGRNSREHVVAEPTPVKIRANSEVAGGSPVGPHMRGSGRSQSLRHEQNANVLDTAHVDLRVNPDQASGVARAPYSADHAAQPSPAAAGAVASFGSPDRRSPQALGVLGSLSPVMAK